MYHPTPFTIAPLAVPNSISRSPLLRGFPVILLALALGLFVLSPAARAQLSPAPDGGYPNDNTAEGDNALFNLTTGHFNTALGSRALYSDTTGGSNTATGVEALLKNTTGMPRRWAALVESVGRLQLEQPQLLAYWHQV